MHYSLNDLKKRHSVRSYTKEPIPLDLINKIKAEITMINTHESGIKFCLCVNDNNPFKTFRQSYGFFANANNYITCVIDPYYKYSYQRAGFFAQQIVMKVSSLGLGTCYVGGTYDKNAVSVDLKAGEKLLFIILLGFEDKTKIRPVARIAYTLIHSKKMSLSDFMPNLYDQEAFFEKNPKLKDAIEAISVSPSSLNKRPARIKYDKGNVLMYVESNSDKSQIDLGIAQFNFQAVYPGEWEWGNPSLFIPFDD